MRTILTAAAVLLLNWHTEAAHAQSPLCLPYEPETSGVDGNRAVSAGLSPEAAQAIRKIIPVTKIKIDESSEGLRASFEIGPG
jgi:hypothetical protein